MQNDIRYLKNRTEILERQLALAMNLLKSSAVFVGMMAKNNDSAADLMFDIDDFVKPCSCCQNDKD